MQYWYGHSSEVLSPRDWYSRGHDHDSGYHNSNGFWWLKIKSGLLIQNLPLVAAEKTLEELGKAQTKRRASTQLIVIPIFFTPL